MSVKMVAIKPKRPLADTKQMDRLIENALTAVAKGARVDFNVTTQTWRDKPVFRIHGRAGQRIVGTQSLIYSYVEHGTKPHIIRPKNGKRLVFNVGGSPKTKPGSISSSAGSKGATRVAAKVVNHPGTKARNFSQIIADKWSERFHVLLQKAIDEGVKP